MTARVDVNRLLDGELGRWLAGQAPMRAEAKEKAHSRWTIAAAIAMPALAFLWFGPDWGTEAKFWISAIVAGAGFAWGHTPIREAKKRIKTGINCAIAEALGLEYELDVEPGAQFDAAKQYGLVPRFHEASFEDRWHGTLEGHAFELYEAHLQERRKSGKNSRLVTVFRGAIIRMEFGQPFRSTTLLQRAGKHRKWLGLGARKDAVELGGHRLDYVDQVHPDFEDVFEVWSDDQVEARTLVHPRYVEDLLAIERGFDGEAVRALFKTGEIVIAIESGNMFESGAIEADGDRERAEECARQFATLARLATSFNATGRAAR